MVSDMRKITILGVGNILLMDEGFGVRVIESLQQRYCFPDTVQVLDGGTLGMELLRYIVDTKQLILVDAVLGNLAPGGIYELANDAVVAYFRDSVSLHELGIQDVLHAMNILEEPLPDITVFGVQPAVVAMGLELSPLVNSRIEAVIEKSLINCKAWMLQFVLNNS